MSEDEGKKGKKTKWEVCPKDENKEFWERHECETFKSWQGFEYYRNMGPSRTLKKVADYMGHENKVYVGKWSQWYKWTARAKAYDDHISEVRLSAREKAVAEAESKLAEALPSVLEKAIEIAAERGDRKMIIDLLDRAGVDFSENDRLDLQVESTSLSDILGQSLNDLSDS